MGSSSDTTSCEKSSCENPNKECHQSSFYSTLRTVLTVVAIITLIFTIIFLITKIYSNIKLGSFLKKLECEIQQISASTTNFFDKFQR
jgi:hypothetical protein